MRRVRLAAALVLLAVCGACLVAAVRMARVPAWATRGSVDCASGRGSQPESASHRAGRELEELVASEWHRLRPASEAWTMAIPLGAVQGWLDCRLPEWIAHGGVVPVEVPEGVRLAEQPFPGGASRLVIGLPADGWFLSASVALERRADSWEPVVLEAWVGEQSIPAAWIGALGWDPTTVKLPSEITLGDGRHVSIDAVALSDGQVRLSLRTRLGDRPVGG